MRGLSSLVVAVGVVVGATTGLLRADRGWSQMISTDCGLSDVWGSGPNDVFAVGATGDSPGKILHYQDQGQHALSITVVNGKSGQVRLDPSPSSDWSATRYLADTLVTLTAEPAQGKKFCEWTLYDPDHPNDANYATLDGNSVITIRMNSDHGVQARFQCALGVGPMLPLMVAGLAGLMASRRRK